MATADLLRRKNQIKENLVSQADKKIALNLESDAGFEGGTNMNGLELKDKHYRVSTAQNNQAARKQRLLQRPISSNVYSTNRRVKVNISSKDAQNFAKKDTFMKEMKSGRESQVAR